MSPNPEHIAMSMANVLGRRDDGCLECDQSQPLVCPSNCQAGTSCTFATLSCHQCPYSYCAPNPTSAPAVTTAPTSSGPSVGAIAGGVVGGVAAIAILTYLVWRYCIKNKRQPLEQEPWDEVPSQSTESAEKDFASLRDQRASVHTVHSIASTVLTRASNIIQIAYIPGVTNRAAPTSPTLLVPPVPPIPIALSQQNSPAATEDQHFFVPGDLRDSTYSGFSGYSDRTSYARTSYAPRSSVASTIYGKNAVIVAPAQTGMRVKPGMVNVRSATSGSGQSTPPVPSVDYDKYNGLRPPSPTGSTFSVGSTFLNNASAHTAMPVQAKLVRVGSGAGNSAKKVVVGKPRTPGESSTPRTASPASTPPIRESAAVTIIEDSPAQNQGPFSDPPVRSSSPRLSPKSTTSLSAVIEEATRRASQRDSQIPAKERERSPFGDEHATKD